MLVFTFLLAMIDFSLKITALCHFVIKVVLRSDFLVQCLAWQHQVMNPSFYIFMKLINANIFKIYEIGKFGVKFRN